MPWYRRGQGCICTPFPLIALLHVVLVKLRLKEGCPLEISDQEGPSVPGTGVDSPPLARDLGTVGLAPERCQLIDSGLPTKVVETNLNASTPFCTQHYIDPVHYLVLVFLQDCLLAGLSHATLKVYLATILLAKFTFDGAFLGGIPLCLILCMVPDG